MEYKVELNLLQINEKDRFLKFLNRMSKFLSHYREYVSSTYSVLTNFPRITINGDHQIQYNFVDSISFHRKFRHLHEPSIDDQKKNLATLIILHGTGGGIDAARWHALGLSEYSCHSHPYQILSLSRPGYLSSQPKSNSFSHEASILNQLCQYFDLKQVSIMAVSGSGPVALTFLRDYPHRVNGE